MIMPRRRNSSSEDSDNFENFMQVQMGNLNLDQQGLVQCCVPGKHVKCDRPHLFIDPEEPRDAVRVICSNHRCPQSQWMHVSCFRMWEDRVVLNHLKTCGRARGWSEKQRLQNVWTKKGYDLVFKVCQCSCGIGHLRKDLSYFPVKHAVDAMTPRKRGKARRNSRPIPVMPKGPPNGYNNRLMRPRTSSLTSTGSSPPSSIGSPPISPDGSYDATSLNKAAMFERAEVAARGNIFSQRTDLQPFYSLPRYKRNPYCIKTEDEGPHGNDETRCFILSNLSMHLATNVSCVLCERQLTVYDKYPIIDGTFFLTPIQNKSSIEVVSDRRRQYMEAVCMWCLESGCEVTCSACNTRWNGTSLQIGSMYFYDIFAATPCCKKRLACKACSAELPNPVFYSAFSHTAQCPSCHQEDYHYVRPIRETYNIRQSVWR